MNMPRTPRLLAGPLEFTRWRADAAAWTADGLDSLTPSLDDAAAGRVGQKADVPEPTAPSEANPVLLASLGRRYEPLHERPALFREFASLPFDRAAYLDFCLRYGPLASFAPDERQRLSYWVNAHAHMRASVRMMDSLQAGSTIDLGELGIEFDDCHTLDRMSALSMRSIWVELATTAELSAVFSTTNHTPCEDEAHQHPFPVPERLVAGWAKPRTSPRRIVQNALFGLTTTALREHTVSPKLASNGSPLGSGLQLAFEVNSLIGAMWVQLALAVDGNRTYKQCPICGEWWDATDARPHKTVCSDRCRAKRSYLAHKAASQDGDT